MCLVCHKKGFVELERKLKQSLKHVNEECVRSYSFLGLMNCNPRFIHQEGKHAKKEITCFRTHRASGLHRNGKEADSSRDSGGISIATPTRRLLLMQDPVGLGAILVPENKGQFRVIHYA